MMSRYCFARMIVFCVFVGCVCSDRANAELMKVWLDVQDPQSHTSLAELSPGQTFNLVAMVEDVRDEPTGVFAAFMDIEYAPAQATVAQSIVHRSELYPNYVGALEDGIFSSPGLLDEIGAFGTLERPGAGPHKLFHVSMQAGNQLGELPFSLTYADNTVSEILLYGHDDVIPFTDVTLQGVTVSVVPEPSSCAMLLCGILCLMGRRRQMT
ncbi:MAG: PEP-CTERM sorting domain-containing protein [Pirellulaceae bacterium]